LHSWGLGEIPELSSIRISILTQRSSESTSSRCSIVLKADALNREGTIITDEHGDQLSQGINVHFDTNPHDYAFNNCLCWKMVVKFLQDAAIKAFNSDGVHQCNANGHVQSLMGRIWVESGRYIKQSHTSWLKDRGLTDEGETLH
jgi:hypothetical protein